MNASQITDAIIALRLADRALMRAAENTFQERMALADKCLRVACLLESELSRITIKVSE